MNLPSVDSTRSTSSLGLELPSRTTTEDYALDSFQNLLFSIARFRAVTEHYPSKITVVGYAFKRRRYTELHSRAIRWPQNAGFWKYVGIDVEDEGEKAEAMAGEVYLHLSI